MDKILRSRLAHECYYGANPDNVNFWLLKADHTQLSIIHELIRCVVDKNFLYIGIFH